MSKSVEFCFDYVSPMSYFGWTRLKEMRARMGFEIQITPVFLGGIMQATGNRPPGAVAAKADFLQLDIGRHCKRYTLPFRFNPDFPMNTRSLLRATIGYLENPDLERLIDLGFHYGWVEPKNLADEVVLREVLAAEGFDPDELMALAAQQDNKDRLLLNTQNAVARGVFGAPTFFVGDAMYFGQDRLDFVEDALTNRVWV
jgi:2-hydroxychromene-2-carboxylate isomerase